MAEQNSKGNEGLIAQATAADLVEFAGMDPGAARLVTGKDPKWQITPAPKVDLPGEFRGAVIIGEPRETEITLQGPFTGASNGGIVVATARQIAEVANGNLKAPDLLKKTL
jgi:hypothetical protein